MRRPRNHGAGHRIAGHPVADSSVREYPSPKQTPTSAATHQHGLRRYRSRKSGAGWRVSRCRNAASKTDNPAVADERVNTNSSTAPTRFLLDTNVIIALEPYAGQMEAGMTPAATFVRLAMKQGHHVFVHPASRDELAEGSDPTRVQQRMAELKKFDLLAESPISSTISNELGPVELDSNDHRDRRILAALNSNAVNFLVSDDVRLRQRAKRIGVGDRVLTLADAAAMLEGFEPSIAPPPPRVTVLPPYALDLEQDIFDSLRIEYQPDFDDWIAKVQADSSNRECFVIEEADGTYAAIAIVKINESDCAYPFTQPVSKISTFKVAEQFSGSRYGELLLKAVLRSHHDHGVGSAYVEVRPHHQPLIDFLGQFGYVEGAQSARGELVLLKSFQPRDESLPPLDYHIRYGPPAISTDASVFVIPIRAHWHDQLFPECASDAVGDQLTFPDIAGQATRPWGNALRKAYLCNAPTKQVRPGDVILFYRSGLQVVSVVGVVERTHRTFAPDEVLNLVAGRTVYGTDDISELATHSRGVLILLFRKDRDVEPPWTDSELIANGVLNGPPQTVTKVKEVGTQWVHQQLADR